MSVCAANIKDIKEILFVITRSNSETYRNIIPTEYFLEPV
jgi:hypothetical protein